MVRREILRQGFLQEQFQILFLIVAQHETHGFDIFPLEGQLLAGFFFLTTSKNQFKIE